MKKYTKITLGIIIGIFLYTAATQFLASTPSDNMEDVPLKASIEKMNVEYVQPSATLVETEKLTLLEKYTFDSFENKPFESVELYTAAGKDDKGQMMWDDGQNWLLVVKGKDKEYVLFDQYVQLGGIDFWVYTSGENNDLNIVTLQPGSASMRLTNYVFDKAGDQFIKEVHFNPGNVNLLYFSK